MIVILLDFCCLAQERSSGRSGYRGGYMYLKLGFGVNGDQKWEEN